MKSLSYTETTTKVSNHQRHKCCPQGINNKELLTLGVPSKNLKAKC